MTEQQGITQADKTQKDTGAAGSQDQENKDLTKGALNSENKSKETKEKEGEQEETLVIKGIEKLSDGTFEFRVDPEDENSTVYRGKTIDEVLDKLREGTKVKDSLLRKVKFSERLNGKSERRKGLEEEDDEDHPKVKAPDEREIANRHFKEVLEQSGITLEQARNVENDQFWEKYKEDHPEASDLSINRLRTKIDRVLEKANEEINSEVSEAKQMYQDEQTRSRAVKTVSELLEEAKIPIEQVGEGKAFDFYAILEKAQGPNGLDGEKVLLEAQRAIRKIERDSDKSATQRKLSEDAAKAKKDREKLAGPGGAGQERTKTIIPAKDYRSATATALKEYTP